MIDQMNEVTLSIIIVNWNTCDITRNCLRSVREKVAGINCEVIVVDNASSDASVEMIRAEFPGAHLIVNDDNLGFGRANNQAMRVARGRYFLLLNSDTLLIDDSVERLVSFMESDPGVGIAGCKLLFEDMTLQGSCSRFPSIKIALLEDLMLYKFLSRQRQGELLLNGYWAHDRTRDVDAVWGAAMLVRREVFEQTAGFDERMFMYGEDLEWCMRVHDLGWRITFAHDCRIIHLNHKSAEIKYGDERVDLCHKRAYEIYRRRQGVAAMSVLMLIKTIGALIRVCYFGLRATAASGAKDYFNSQAKFYNRSLKYHLRAIRGRKLAVE
jgi:GT2 family glycosyltransferase